MTGLSGLSDPTSGSFQAAKSQSAPLSMPRLTGAASSPALPSERHVSNASHASRGSLAAFEASTERPVRLQLMATLMLGLVIVAIPLYLWRRPRALPAVAPGADAVTALAASGTAANAAPPDMGTLSVAEAKTLSCGDGAAKRSPSAPPCDRVLELEKALALAITESAACVPREAGGGTIAYVVDVNFKKKALALTTPKEGRSLKDANVTAACQAAVKAKLGSVPLETMAHQRSRYRISTSATYPGPIKL